MIEIATASSNKPTRGFAMHQPRMKQSSTYEKLRHCLFTTLLVCASLWAIPARAAVDMFLVLDGIEGDSTDRQFPKAIEILAWQWGVSSSSSVQAGAGKPTAQDLSFTHFFDKA